MCIYIYTHTILSCIYILLISIILYNPKLSFSFLPPWDEGLAWGGGFEMSHALPGGWIVFFSRGLATPGHDYGMQSIYPSDTVPRYNSIVCLAGWLEWVPSLHEPGS